MERPIGPDRSKDLHAKSVAAPRGLHESLESAPVARRELPIVLPPPSQNEPSEKPAEVLLSTPGGTRTKGCFSGPTQDHGGGRTGRPPGLWSTHRFDPMDGHYYFLSVEKNGGKLWSYDFHVVRPDQIAPARVKRFLQMEKHFGIDQPFWEPKAEAPSGPLVTDAPPRKAPPDVATSKEILGIPFTLERRVAPIPGYSVRPVPHWVIMPYGEEPAPERYMHKNTRPEAWEELECFARVNSESFIRCFSKTES